MNYNWIYDKLFSNDFLYNPSQFEKYIKEVRDSVGNLTEEKVEFEKGDFKTTIIVKFNEKGYPVSHYIDSTSIPKTINLNELKNQLKEALKKEDYIQAAKIKESIDSLNKEK